MPLDPQVKALLDQMASLPRLEELSVADARAQVESRIAGDLPTLPVASVLNRSIPGPGGDLSPAPPRAARSAGRSRQRRRRK